MVDALIFGGLALSFSEPKVPARNADWHPTVYCRVGGGGGGRVVGGVVGSLSGSRPPIHGTKSVCPCSIRSASSIMSSGPGRIFGVVSCDA